MLEVIGTKALSPMIAVILLIAFTIAIGGIISVWLSTLTTSQTETVQSSAEIFSKCAANKIDISQVRYPSAGTPKFVNVSFTTGGSQGIKNITLSVIGGGGVATSVKYFNATGEELPAGASFAASVNAANITLPPEIVTVSGLCLEKFTVTGSCKFGEPCMVAVS